jgi:outer membrane murein-binding lipoprotein Lpp
MTKPAIDKPSRRKPAASPQSATWVVLGALGLGYLGIAFFAPHLLPDFSGGRQHATDANVLKLSADIASLNAKLDSLDRDFHKVQENVKSQADQAQPMSAQLTVLDEKVRLAQNPQSNPALAAPTADASPPAAVDTGPAQDADASPAPPKIINSQPRVGAPIETGSVDKKAAIKPIAFGPAVVKPEPKPVGLQIATDPSVDGLRVTWGALSQIHPEQLGHLKARYADLGTATNPSFGLIAGPVKSKAEARKLCKELAAASVTCKVSEYRGADL